MDRLHPGQIMGQEGCNDQLQKHTGARLEPSQEPGDGEAAPRPLLRRLAEGGLQGRGIGHRASRAPDEALGPYVGVAELLWDVYTEQGTHEAVQAEYVNLREALRVCAP